MKHLFALNKYFLRYKWRMAFGTLFVVASNYFGILIPQKVRDALNYVQDQIQLIKEGPSLARVDHIDVSPASSTGKYKSFEVGLARR